MRIYAVADIHGKAERLARIRENVRTLTPEAVVAAGDITHFRHAAGVLASLADLGVPVLAVRGNTDLPRVEKGFDRFGNFMPLHLKRVELNGNIFAGLSGTALLPFKTKIRYREHDLFRKLEMLIDASTILVTHPPPLGVLDEVFGRFHAGCRRLRNTVRRLRPALVICGHIHERGGTANLGGTTIVNCTMGRGGGGAVIDVRNRRIDSIRMIP